MRGDVLPEIDLWHWGMAGAADSFWYTHPDGVDVGGNKFAESLGNAAGTFLSQYVSSPAIPGDANGDGHVDAQDASILASHGRERGRRRRRRGLQWGRSINAADASILAANWGHGTSETGAVPEPGVIALLLVLGVSILFVGVGLLPVTRTLSSSVSEPRSKREAPFAHIALLPASVTEITAVERACSVGRSLENGVTWPTVERKHQNRPREFALTCWWASLKTGDSHGERWIPQPCFSRARGAEWLRQRARGAVSACSGTSLAMFFSSGTRSE